MQRAAGDLERRQVAELVPRTTPLPAGSKDVAGINWSRFGGNEGIWRLSRNLKDLDIPATLFCNGCSAEVWPGGGRGLRQVRPGRRRSRLAKTRRCSP